MDYVRELGAYTIDPSDLVLSGETQPYAKLQRLTKFMYRLVLKIQSFKLLQFGLISCRTLGFPLLD